MSEKEEIKRITVSLPVSLYWEVVKISEDNEHSKDKTAVLLIRQAVKERQRQRKKNAKEASEG